MPIVVAADPSEPWHELLAGSWIGGAVCPLVRVNPALNPGRRSTICGADSGRTKIAQEGRTDIEGSPNDRSKIRGFRYG